MKSHLRNPLRGEQLESRQLLAGVVINEIHFAPDDSTEQVEFIELHNDSPAAVDLSGWVLDDAVDYGFSPGASIPAGGYLVVAQEAAEFQDKFGFAPLGQWETGDQLNNDGETIQLRNATGQVIDEVDYQLGFPWPTVGDFGRSIELIRPELDNNLAGNWRSSISGSLPQTPQTLLAAAASDWHYRKGTSEASTPIDGWRQPEFVEDGSWQTGQTPIGYGDGDDNTVLADMRNLYTSVYLRNTFTIHESVPSALQLRVYADDGAAVWINGVRVGLFHVEDTELAYDDTAFNHDAEWEVQLISGVQQYLTVGENTIAIHGLNTNPNSSDFSIDAELIIPGSSEIGFPTPGERNSTYASNSAPQLRQLRQSVQQPDSGEEVAVTIKVTDPDGVQEVSLDYQLVDPGNYIRMSDAAYQTDWTSLAMRDDGQNGDVVAGDDIFSVVLAGSLNTHRRLVRYRITAADSLGATVTGPYADDPQPNFAYFVYDQVPDYSGSMRPGVEPVVTYPGHTLDNLATYHLIANGEDVNNSQYNGSYNLVQFNGTLVYDGIVYDHIEFRNRGRASTYQVGKNKWKLNFNRGHALEARDNFGNRYEVDWDKINILPGTNPWWRNDVSTEGTVLFEPTAFRLYELMGTPSSQTHYFQFRVIDDAAETAAGDQYGGDFWGLYIGIEQPDGRFLDQRDLPDGNIFNMHGSTFGATSQRNQGADLPTDRSDLQAFISGIGGGYSTLADWEQGLNLDSYFAWNMANHLVNNSDIRSNENVNYYHNQETGQWYILPWDLDLTFEDAPHHSTPVTQRENIRSVLAAYPSVLLAYENRLREVADLLLDNEDAARVVEEYANILTGGGLDHTITDANQAQWDYHPRKRKSGIWYENFNPTLLPSQDFSGLVAYMQDFVSPGGYGYDLLAGQGDDQGIPYQPTLSYVGQPDFPRDGLVFQTSAFNDPQGSGTFAAMEWRVAEVHNRAVANYDPSRPYIYEMEGTWESGELTSFDSQINLPEVALEDGKTYRARVRMQDNSGHWSHWSDAQEFLVTASANPSLSKIVISEINFHPHDTTPAEAIALPGVTSDEFEFLEILNTSQSETVNLKDFQLSDAVSFTIGDVDLGPGQTAVVVEDVSAFQQRYGTSVTVLGAWSGGLSNSGESIVFSDAHGSVLSEFQYGDRDPWPETADGDGATLVLVDPFLTPAEQFDKYYRWRGSTEFGGSPGYLGDAPMGVVVNEVLSHTDAPQLDSIELLNTTDQTIDLGGWFLSDSANDLLKYPIPAGTLLEPNAILVFDEHDFNPNPADPSSKDFSLNGAEGDDVYLVIPDAHGGVAAFVDHVQFGAAANGQSLGRHPDGSGRLVPLTNTSLGQKNGTARVGPLVISEIHYHPGTPSAAALAIETTLTADDLEFIEIHNPTSMAVDLTDWRLRGEADYDFPVGTSIGPGQLLLLASFDPADVADADRLLAFRTHYQIDTDVVVLGAYEGGLNNGFGLVRLQRPDQPPLDDPGFIPRLTEDEVLYDDLAPWPAAADGSGSSLQRVAVAAYGNDPASWQASPQLGGSPGELALPPFVSGATFQYQTTRDLDLSFGAPIATATLEAADFTLQNLTTSQTLAAEDYSLANLTEAAVSIVFLSPPANGNWQLSLSAGSFEDPQGITNAMDFRFDFFVLAGDYNRDRSVGAADFTIWHDTLGSTDDLRANGSQTGLSEGLIDQADYNSWFANFGATLPTPPPAVTIVASRDHAGDQVSRNLTPRQPGNAPTLEGAASTTDKTYETNRWQLRATTSADLGPARALPNLRSSETPFRPLPSLSAYLRSAWQAQPFHGAPRSDVFGPRQMVAKDRGHAARDAAFGEFDELPVTSPFTRVVS